MVGIGALESVLGGESCHCHLQPEMVQSFLCTLHFALSHPFKGVCSWMFLNLQSKEFFIWRERRCCLFLREYLSWEISNLNVVFK